MDRLYCTEQGKRKRFVRFSAHAQATNSCNCSHVNIDTFPTSMTLTMTFNEEDTRDDNDKLARFSRRRRYRKETENHARLMRDSFISQKSVFAHCWRASSKRRCILRLILKYTAQRSLFQIGKFIYFHL